MNTVSASNPAASVQQAAEHAASRQLPAGKVVYYRADGSPSGLINAPILVSVGDFYAVATWRGVTRSAKVQR